MPKNGLFQKNPNRRGEEEGRGEDIFFWKKSLECLASYVTNLRNFTAEKSSFYPFSLSDPWNFHIMMLFLFKIPLPGNSIACPISSSTPHLLGHFLEFLLSPIKGSNCTGIRPVSLNCMLLNVHEAWSYTSAHARTYSVFGLLRGRIHTQLATHEKRQFDDSFSYPPSHSRNVKRGNENY